MLSWDTYVDYVHSLQNITGIESISQKYYIKDIHAIKRKNSPSTIFHCPDGRSGHVHASDFPLSNTSIVKLIIVE
jgi:hypothetical protein